jgi:hypothetical protein
LTNLNAITCPTCSSKLRVKNKGTNSAIGAVLGGVGGGLGALLAISYLLSRNVAFLGLDVLLIAGVFFSAWFWEIKYIKLKVEA